MNTIEERIRAAARAAAQTVPPDGVPPLELPARRARTWRIPTWLVPAGRFPARRSHRAGWPAAAAAAVAVIVIVVTAAIVTGRGTAAGPNRSPASVRSGSPSAAALVKSGQIPAYYLAIIGTKPVGTAGPTYVVVRATVTGKALATIRVSVPGGAIMGVTAAANDRTFIMEEQPMAKVSRNQRWAPRTFYQVQLDSAGQPGPVRALPLSLPQNRMLTGFALSADGSKLALGVTQVIDGGKNFGTTSVIVDDLATGQSHSWTGNGLVGDAADGPQALSWTSDGQTLAIEWQSNSRDYALSGVWLLHPARGGSNLIASSREVFPFTWDASEPACAEGVDVAVLAPGGSVIVCDGVRTLNASAVMKNKGTRDESESAFLEFSPVTGKLQRILGHWTAADTQEMWLNSSGSLIIGLGGPRGQLGVTSARGFTPLPGVSTQVVPQALTW